MANVLCLFNGWHCGACVCGRIYKALVLYLKVKPSREAQKSSSSVSPSPQVVTATTWFLAIGHSPLNAVTCVLLSSALRWHQTVQLHN